LKLLLVCFSALFSLNSFSQDPLSDYWFVELASQDTITVAFIDYRELPKEKVLYIHNTDGSRDTITNPLDSILVFYADNSLFYPFKEQKYFSKNISQGRIPLFEYSYDVVTASRWQDEFNIKNYLYSTPGSSLNFFTDRRIYHHFILNGDTHTLNKTNYRELLWPKIRETFELNKRSIEKAKPWQWVSIIDYYNGNFSTLTNRKNETETVFGLDVDFRDGFLTHLSYYDYKGEYHELNSREECLRIKSFNYQGQYFELLIENELLQELDELPRHTWKRMDGPIELYYYENFITYRNIKEAFETTELEEIWIVRSPNDGALHLFTEEYLKEEFKQVLLALPAFKKHFKDKWDSEEFDSAFAIALYNYWAKKSPTE
jgi:hypothetical protein